ncbi:hypothetical protein ST45_05680 [Prevotella pectinovora]|uniref:hypothetical protein n=2 Tax=Prevotella TaxID=838 RepID=UPI0005B6A7E5|nr:hypothetical protein [Prevotella pectinovora]KIP62251.1 hypothetical protein ST45_05680 [Prevotella pectinovora]
MGDKGRKRQVIVASPLSPIVVFCLFLNHELWGIRLASILPKWGKLLAPHVKAPCPTWASTLPIFNPNRSLGLAWILLFRRVDFVWLLMSNSELLRIKNKQKTPYKKQKTASSKYKIQ